MCFSKYMEEKFHKIKRINFGSGEVSDFKNYKNNIYEINLMSINFYSVLIIQLNEKFFKNNYIIRSYIYI